MTSNKIDKQFNGALKINQKYIQCHMNNKLLIDLDKKLFEILVVERLC